MQLGMGAMPDICGHRGGLAASRGHLQARQVGARTSEARSDQPLATVRWQAKADQGGANVIGGGCALQAAEVAIPRQISRWILALVAECGRSVEMPKGHRSNRAAVAPCADPSENGGRGSMQKFRMTRKTGISRLKR